MGFTVLISRTLSELFSKRARALGELRKEFAKVGERRVGELMVSDSSSQVFKVGAEITLCFDDDMPIEYIALKIPEIRAINERVAEKFGLDAIGIGPLIGEMGVKVVYCGFRHE